MGYGVLDEGIGVLESLRRVGTKLFHKVALKL